MRCASLAMAFFRGAGWCCLKLSGCRFRPRSWMPPYAVSGSSSCEWRLPLPRWILREFPPATYEPFSEQLQRTPSPLAGKGKRPQVGQALSGRPRVASESFVTHLTCERAEHRPSAGDWQALFHLAQSFFDEAQHVHAVERLAVSELRPREDYLQRDAGAFQLRARLGRRLAHSGRWPALRHSFGDTGRTAREQARHFFARLSGTPVAPCALSPARKRNQFGALIARTEPQSLRPCAVQASRISGT